MVVVANVLDGPFRICCLHNNRMEMAQTTTERREKKIFISIFMCFVSIISADIRDDDQK